MSTAISDKISAGTLSDIELIGIVRDEDVLSTELNYILQNGFGTKNLSAGDVHDLESQGGPLANYLSLDITDKNHPVEVQLTSFEPNISGYGLVVNLDSYPKTGNLCAGWVQALEVHGKGVYGTYSQFKYARTNSISSEYIRTNDIYLTGIISSSGTIYGNTISSKRNGLIVDDIDVETALKALSTNLTGGTTYQNITFLSNTIDSLSTNLSNAITGLSTDLSNAITSLSNHLSTDLSDFEKITHQAIDELTSDDCTLQTWIHDITSFYQLSAHYLIDEDHPTEVYKLTLKSGAVHVEKTDKAVSDLTPPIWPRNFNYSSNPH